MGKIKTIEGPTLQAGPSGPGKLPQISLETTFQWVVEGKEFRSFTLYSKKLEGKKEMLA